MCGRFTLRTPAAQLVEQFELESLAQLPLRFNVAPTQPVAAIRNAQDGSRQVAMLRWGLVPSWSKDAKGAFRMINARAETVADKPAFRAAFERRRCLVLADGYFEWIKEGKIKQPYYIRMRDERPFAFAGLWEVWREPETRSVSEEREDAEKLETCTIVTTQSNVLTRSIHDRMPVILDSEDYATWLNVASDEVAPLQELLRPFDSDRMIVDPVDTRVNNVRNDDADCVRIQSRLF